MHVTIEPRKLLAHRGCWTDVSGQTILEKNSLSAISRARDLGFGLETDIRDRLGELVISHDPANAQAQVTDLSTFHGFAAPVALNIKADGIARRLQKVISNIGSATDFFFFDMSIPESLQYRRLGLTVADRSSERENFASSKSDWVWLDCFESDWYLEKLTEISDEMPDTKICIVSPELHGRAFDTTWSALAGPLRVNPNLFLCTDFPEMFLEKWG